MPALTWLAQMISLIIKELYTSTKCPSLLLSAILSGPPLLGASHQSLFQLGSGPDPAGALIFGLDAKHTKHER